MKSLILNILIVFTALELFAQKDAKKGWNLGVLPSIAYDADLGFQYGALANLFYYGDGSQYPEYLHSIYAEAAYTTKQNGLMRLNFFSRSLLPGYKLFIDATYIPDAMSDFTGFNGYQTIYNADWCKNNSDDYLSRAFYKYKRNMFRTSADIQKNITNNFNWNVGIGYYIFEVNRVNINKLNKGQKDSKKLPNIDGIYDKYIKWGLIDENETGKASFPYVHGGLTFDSRSQTSAPTSGIWADAFFTYTAAFGSHSEYNNLKFNANFKQYISLGTPRVIFAYRIGTQLTMSGKTPFYMLCNHNTLEQKRAVYESLGGSSSLRGILRNRIISNGYALLNTELRIKIKEFNIANQHFYIGINPFIDAGMVIQPVDVNEQEIIEITKTTNDDVNEYFDFSKSKIYQPHVSGGTGLKIAMNENFILSVDWATYFNSQDNDKKSNIYVKMGYLF